MINGDIERAIVSASGWLRGYFFTPDADPVSDTTIRLFLNWAVNCRKLGASRNLVSDEDIRTLAWRFRLTPDRIRSVLMANPSPTAFRILSDLAAPSSDLASPFDQAAGAADVRAVRSKLEEALNDERHVARRDILIGLLDQDHLAEIAKRSDFWADFVTFDIELSHLLGVRLDPERIGGYARLLDRLQFKYLSLRDADRLCPVLRAQKYLFAEPSAVDRRGLSFLAVHCFDDGGVAAQAVALHLAREKAETPADLELQVTVKTTISTLVTLLEADEGAAETPPGGAMRRPERSRRAAATDLRPAVRTAEKHALDWVQRSLPSFDPHTYADADKFEFAVKMLAELAFVCSRFSACNDASVVQVVGDIHKTAFERMFGRAGLQSFLLQNLSTLPGFSIYASLRECGHDDPQFFRKLESCCRQSNLVRGEYAPALFMDLAHSVVRCGLPWIGPSLATLFERSQLASLPDWPSLKDPDYYTVTHAIFFLTDFGRHPERIPDDVRAHFADGLDDMMFLFAARGHWDLLGEVLLCGIYLGLDETASRSAFLALLLSAQEADGSFTCSVGTKSKDEKADAWSQFLDKYHTTLVALLLTAALRAQHERDGADAAA